MGAGRYTQTFHAGESITSSSFLGNGENHTRNLRKNDLGGVIFGCKHNTMQECLSKQLFGLPQGHFSYVKNITEGMPLFLFNYSNRRLHGIYEAASPGHMTYDPYAWTNGGSERTPFPAQVYIRTRTQCQPLLENQFSKVIADNYFSYQHFWFELDHAQTRGLLAAFIPFPPSSVMLPSTVPSRKEPLPSLPANKWLPPSKKDHFTSQLTSKWKAVNNRYQLNSDASNQLTDHQLTAESKSAWADCNSGERTNVSPRISSDTGFDDKDSKGTVSDWEDMAEDNSNCLNSCPTLNGVSSSSKDKQFSKEGLDKEKKRVLHLLEKLVAEREHTKSSPDAKCSTPNDHYQKTAKDAQHLPVSNGTSANGCFVEKQGDTDQRYVELVQFLKALERRTSDLEEQRAELTQEVEHLTKTVGDAESTIQLLQDRVEELESRINPSVPLEDYSFPKLAGKYFGPEDAIYLIGGFDGNSWLSSLDCFFPSLNIITSRKSMNSARSYTSSVALDGILYVFGGSDGDLWFDTVECYDKRHDQWMSCPSMLCKKGSLSGVALDGKIFAIGGGDGRDSLSDVEIFDPNQGRWMNGQPMHYQRFAPAATELNGAIYALGGYDGNDYLQSVERFDPREGTWTEIPGMNTRRGCHSAAVLNEKIYCFGGYDGEKIVSSLETFDPRSNTWAMGDPMQYERGYAASAVIGNSLFCIGGVKDDKMIVDTVECYREGAGWITGGWSAVGRCFCSAVVL